MVYDTESEDIIFHEEFEDALIDYNDALTDVRAGGKVYLFEVKKMDTKGLIAEHE